MLNLFYEEPDPDRWLPLDRYPRRTVRRIVRGRRRPGGQERVFLNLQAGLDKLGLRYRINDYGYIRRHPNETACVIGKPHLLDKQKWTNPMVFGAAVHSHPLERPELLEEFPNIRTILVPGEWMRQMCAPYWGDKVIAWPVGIDTDEWIPSAKPKQIDFLLYDKVRWHHGEFRRSLIAPIYEQLTRRKLMFETIRYGAYQEQDFRQLLDRSRAMIFLCEHETQGIAYQQALSCEVPILAWDRGGYWQDPAFYPEKVKFEPVTSVPYWDERCGVKFQSADDFQERLEEFLDKLAGEWFAPRDYILANLTLEKCAQRYLQIVEGLTAMN